MFNVSWIKMIREGPTFWEYNYNKMKSVITKGWLSTLWELLSDAKELKIDEWTDLGIDRCALIQISLLCVNCWHSQEYPQRY